MPDCEKACASAIAAVPSLEEAWELAKAEEEEPRQPWMTPEDAEAEANACACEAPLAWASDCASANQQFAQSES